MNCFKLLLQQRNLTKIALTLSQVIKTKFLVIYIKELKYCHI